ncbi:MAG TPA: hypothetical protein VKT82_11140 [Ktedonobacterales bacterium]|nr:hypothetical protein [Ktedonobacterales bacterium]
MLSKKTYAFPLSLLLFGLLVGLGACAPYAASQPASPGGKPDSVSIQIDDHIDQPKPVVTLNDPSRVQRLYDTIYALAWVPAQQACTDELGPHYSLTFSQAGKTLVTALAMRDGCRPVSITGETQDRQTTPDFWNQLDQVIYAAEPPANPSSLAVEHTPNPTQSPQTAQITDSKTAQRLYRAILALPLQAANTNCTDSGIYEYQLVFQAAQQTIPAIISTPCNSITLEGHYQTRGGTYTMNDQFKQVFAATMAGATFAPARPDHLTMEMEKALGTASEQEIHDAALMEQLYQKVFTLHTIAPQPDCPSEADKVDGKGIWYTFSFSQWNLPILQISAFEGSCYYVAFSLPNQQLQGDQEFWKLVHQAAGQQ